MLASVFQSHINWLISDIKNTTILGLVPFGLY